MDEVVREQLTLKQFTFVHYLILGWLSVWVCCLRFERFLQMPIIDFKSKNELFLFLTRNISDEGRKYGPRVFTWWNASHIGYFALGSYLFPDKRILLWWIGLAWEIFEHFVGIANPMDIVWNTIGIALGAFIQTKGASLL